MPNNCVLCYNIWIMLFRTEMHPRAPTYIGLLHDQRAQGARANMTSASRRNEHQQRMSFSKSKKKKAEIKVLIRD